MSKNKMKNLKIEYTKSYIVKINRVFKKTKTKQKLNIPTFIEQNCVQVFCLPVGLHHMCV